jgi:hypothetical protein
MIVAGLAAGAVVFAISQGDDPTTEPDQPPTEFFSGGLGIVAAITATAEAGGVALDPTALVSPTVLADEVSASAIAVPPTSAPAPTQRPNPTLSTAAGPVSPGETISIRVDGAAPNDQFEISINGEPVSTSGNPTETADPNGTANVLITVPESTSTGTIEIVFSGGQSGTATTSLEISVTAPLVTVDPQSPVAGESVTVSADELTPGMMVTVRIGGQMVGSAVSGNDGSFSITTRVPELEQGAHSISLEGQSGQLASSELTIAPDTPVVGGIAQPTASPQVTGQQANGADSQDGTNSENQQSADSTGPGADDGSSTSNSLASELPIWLYLVIGAVAGWLGLLTIWVVRLDRRRDSHVDALVQEVARLVELEQVADVANRESDSPAATGQQDYEQAA